MKDINKAVEYYDLNNCQIRNFNKIIKDFNNCLTKGTLSSKDGEEELRLIKELHIALNRLICFYECEMFMNEFKMNRLMNASKSV